MNDRNQQTNEQVMPWRAFILISLLRVLPPVVMVAFATYHELNNQPYQFAWWLLIFAAWLVSRARDQIIEAIKESKRGAQ